MFDDIPKPKQTRVKKNRQAHHRLCRFLHQTKHRNPRRTPLDATSEPYNTIRNPHEHEFHRHSSNFKPGKKSHRPRPQPPRSARRNGAPRKENPRTTKIPNKAQLCESGFGWLGGAARSASALRCWRGDCGFGERRERTHRESAERLPSRPAAPLLSRRGGGGGGADAAGRMKMSESRCARLASLEDE
jgi:hypothetical protein